MGDAGWGAAGASGRSRWRERLALAVLAAAGLAISIHLAAYQLGAVAEPWDPLFGPLSSARVLRSALSRALPVPDAAVGAAAYALEIALDLAGGAERWRTHPGIVLAFGAVATALGLSGVALVFVQVAIVRSGCLLCLGSAAASIGVAAAVWSGGELEAALQERRLRPRAGAGDDGGGRSGRPPGGRVPGRPRGTSSRGRDGMGALKGRVVVVTGASSGVGRATARAFGAAGAKVGLIARTREALERCAEEIRSAGGEALPLPLDVADAAAVERAADEVVARWGRIDTWVNDAMVSVFSPVKEMRPEEYRRVTEVNYLGFVHGTLAALRHMLPRDEGHVIQIGSALAYRSIPLQSAYCASKAAVRGFTDSLRCELRHDRSRVKLSMVQLPAVNTPQFDVVRSRLPNHPQPVPPIYQPEVIARGVLWVAEHPRRELWIGWSTLGAIVGQKLVPGLLDRYLGRTGYASQQTDQPVPPGRPDNVDRPLPGDRGAHGDFDARAHRFSTELWLRRWRTPLAAAAALGAVALLRARTA